MEELHLSGQNGTVDGEKKTFVRLFARAKTKLRDAGYEPIRIPTSSVEEVHSMKAPCIKEASCGG